MSGAGMEKFIKANDVAEIVGVSLTTIRRLTMNKEIPCYKFNRAVRYKPDEIELWLEGRRQKVEEKDKKNLAKSELNNVGKTLFESGAGND